MSNAAIEVGSVLHMGGMYGRVAVQVIRVSGSTVEFKFVGKTGVQIMPLEVFAHKVVGS